MKLRDHVTKISRVSIAVTVLFFIFGTNVIASNLDSGIVAYWSFDDGTALDNSGNGNDGVLYGGVVSATGVSGQGFYFDGLDDIIEVADDPSLDITGDITISAWINLESMPFVASILAKGDNQGNFGYFLAAGTNYLGGSTSWQVANGADVRSRLDGNQSLLTDRWYHVVGVRNGTTMDVYVNGSQVNTGSCFADDLRTNDIPLRIGYYHSDYYFHGIVDEVRIFNRALSSSEVLALYQQNANFCSTFTGLFCDDFENYLSTSDSSFSNSWTLTSWAGIGSLSIVQYGGDNSLRIYNPDHEFTYANSVRDFPFERIVECEVVTIDYGQSSDFRDWYGGTLYAYANENNNSAVLMYYRPTGQDFICTYSVDGTYPVGQYNTLGSGISIPAGQYKMKTAITASAIIYYYDVGNGYILLDSLNHSMPQLNGRIAIGQGGFDVAESYFDNVRLSTLISECPTTGIDWGSPISTGIPGGAPSAGPDGNTLYFAQGAPPDRNIFVSTWDGIDWSTPTSLPSNISSPSFDDADPCISGDGRELYFVSRYRPGGVGNFDVYQSSLVGGVWQEPVNVTTLNSTNAEADPEISKDGSLFFFTSNRPGGYGDGDIWVSSWNGSDWGPVQNLGPSINTNDNEQNAAISANNDTLFFTRFPAGVYMGTLYYSVKQNGVWCPAIEAELGFVGSTSTDATVDPVTSRLYFGGGGYDIHYYSYGPNTGFISSAPLVSIMNDFSSAYYNYMLKMANGVINTLNYQQSFIYDPDYSTTKNLLTELLQQSDNAGIDAILTGTVGLVEGYQQDGFITDATMNGSTSQVAQGIAEYLLWNILEAGFSDVYNDYIGMIQGGPVIAPGIKDKELIVFFENPSPIDNDRVVSINQVLGAINQNRINQIPELIPADFPINQLITDFTKLVDILDKITLNDWSNPSLDIYGISQTIPGYCDLNASTQHSLGLMNYQIAIIQEELEEFTNYDIKTRAIKAACNYSENSSTAFKAVSLALTPLSNKPNYKGSVFLGAISTGCNFGSYLGGLITAYAEVDFVMAYNEFISFWPTYYAESYRFYDHIINPVVDASIDPLLLSCSKKPVDVELFIPLEICVPFLQGTETVSGYVAVT